MEIKTQDGIKVTVFNRIEHLEFKVFDQKQSKLKPVKYTVKRFKILKPIVLSGVINVNGELKTIDVYDTFVRLYAIRFQKRNKKGKKQGKSRTFIVGTTKASTGVVMKQIKDIRIFMGFDFLEKRIDQIVPSIPESFDKAALSVFKDSIREYFPRSKRMSDVVVKDFEWEFVDDLKII